MRQAGKSIAPRALFLPLWLLALCAVVATQRASYARAEESVVEIAYSAPAGCPTKPQFEQRLRARLGNDPRRIHASLSLRLSQHPAHTRGELTITSGPRSGARREVEAPSCDEAVDALTLVTALLIEPDRTQPAPPVVRRAAGPPRAARAPNAEAEAALEPQRANTAHAEPSDVEADAAGAAREPDQKQEGRESTAAPKPPDAAQPATAPKRPAAVTQPAPTQAAATTPAASSPSTLSIDLLAAALLATGALPTPRPGMELRASLARTWAGGTAAAVELGARGLAPQLDENPQGQARFSFYGGTAALCIAHAGARLGASLCALTELARLTAEGRKTDAPKRADVFWRALGPALRTSLRLTSRWSLALGAELLFPLARDSFELGDDELWRVPSLTFRGSLGVVLRFE